MNTKTPILVGVLLFGAIVAANVPRTVSNIEADIAQRTESVLEAQGVAARVEIDGRDVYLSGRVSSAEAQAGALAAVSDLWGVRSVMNLLHLKDSDEPARQAAVVPMQRAKAQPPALRVNFELTKEGVVTLSGQAPSAEAKEAWLAKALALFANGEVHDRLTVHPLEEEAAVVEMVVNEGLTALSDLVEGRLSATTSRLRISGQAANGEVEDAIRKQLRAVLPESYRLAVDVYAPRPLVKTDGAASVMRSMLTRSRDGGVVLSGIAPSAAAKESWVSRAASLYAADRIRDRLKVRVADPPQHYEACLLGALPWVGKLTNGRVEVSPTVVRVFGKAKTAEDANQMRTELEAAGCTLDLARLAVPAAG